MRYFVLLFLTACAGPQLAAPNDPVAAQCQYEAQVAVQRIDNPLYAGYRMAELFNLCMRGKGR